MVTPPPPSRPTFVFDFDSTLVGVESLDELIRISLEELPPEASAKILKNITAITDAGMEGRIDLSESLSLRLAATRIQRKHLEKLQIVLTHSITSGIGAIMQSLQRNGCPIFVISGAIDVCVLPVTKMLGIPDDCVFANMAIFDSAGLLTAIAPGMLVSSRGKIDCITMLRKSNRIPGKVIMIGDGMSDLLPYREGVADDFVGIGIHRVRESVQKEAPHYCTAITELHTLILSLLSP